MTIKDADDAVGPVPITITRFFVFVHRLHQGVTNPQPADICAGSAFWNAVSFCLTEIS
jgi:ABC-type uncharacterized transport system YnjBCD substrate-binding protein